MNAEICVGDKFSSSKELEAKIVSYQNAKFVQLTKQDSRTLDRARKKVPMRVERANPALLYYTLHFACVFGGKRYKNEGTGQRSQQRFVYFSVIIHNVVFDFQNNQTRLYSWH